MENDIMRKLKLERKLNKLNNWMFEFWYLVKDVEKRKMEERVVVYFVCNWKFVNYVIRIF